jgi:DNA-binding MarR family transcriptional regulator
MIQPLSDLVERGLDLYRETARSLHERGVPAWHQVELSVAQLRALFALVDDGPTPIGGVAARLSIGLPAASALVERLVEQGLARRREDRLDRRRTLAEPTEDGDALAQRLRQGSREVLRARLQRMEREDLTALVRGLEALVAIGGSSLAPRSREVGESWHGGGAHDGSSGLRPGLFAADRTGRRLAGDGAVGPG